MKVDLQNFIYQRLKNIKMDDFLEDNLLLLLLLRRRRFLQIFFSQIFTSCITHTCENMSVPSDVF